MHVHSSEITLALAFFLGALHAIEPGHGKSAMLIYLSGERRSLWHPVVMGLSSGLAHSVSLIAIATAVHLTHHLVTGDHYHYDDVAAVGLKWLSAVLVLCVGGWMWWSAARKKPVTCGCRNHRAERCEVAPRRTASSYSMSALLGVAFGLLPCPSALVAYFSSMSAGSPVAAYAVIGLFAAGIACSLILIGTMIQCFGGAWFQRSEYLQRLPWPFLRAGLILAVGGFYVVQLAV